MTIAQMITLLCTLGIGISVMYTGAKMKKGETGMIYDAYNSLMIGGLIIIALIVITAWGLINPDKMNMLTSSLNTKL